MVDYPEVPLDGVPLMSPNCWAVVDAAVRARPAARYLEWGSGNSTIAVLRAALADTDRRLEIVSIEDELGFANAMCGAFIRTFTDRSVDGEITMSALARPRPPLTAAFTRTQVERYEANFLKLLWYTRNDHFWVAGARPGPHEGGPTGALRRLVSGLQCSAAYRYEQLRRAVAPDVTTETTSAGSISAPSLSRITRPSKVTFVTERVRLEYFAIPRLRNRLWRRRRILDGLYHEYADYVGAPVQGRFDVILVDGRARTSCLKRVHHEGLLAERGELFLHDAQRPAYIEGTRLFENGHYIDGDPGPLHGRELFRYPRN